MFLPIWIIGLSIGLALISGAVLLRQLVRMRQGAATFRAIAEGSSDGLVLMEQDSRILWANAAYCRIMGYPLDDILGRYPLEFALPPHLAVSKEEARAFRFDPAQERFGKLTQVENIRGNGELFMHEFSHAVVRTGAHLRFLLAGRDVTERMQREKDLVAAQEKLRRLSFEDSLTGLANRHCHAQEIAALVSRGEPFAVLQIDMNDFKLVNDTHGHAAGDALLVHFAQILHEVSQESWHCARVGGDEFTVLIPKVWALGEALLHASEIFNRAKKPMKWRSGELLPSVSVGAAVCDGQDQSGESVLARADVALYAAKALQGERVVGYDDEMHHAHESEQARRDDFSKALSKGGLSLELVPVVDVATAKILRFDVSLTWQHPVHGKHSQDVLRNMAQQLCQSAAFERQIVKSAQDCASRLQDAGLGHIGIGISWPEALPQDDILDDLIWIADGASPERGGLSVVCPSICFGDGERLDDTKAKLKRLTDAGARIFLDSAGLDIGWVFNLSDLNAAGIALPQSLIPKVDTDALSQALVASTTGLAASLGLAVVGRDVARCSQLVRLRELGCGEVSGPMVAPAMSLERAITWVSNDWPKSDLAVPSRPEKSA